MCTRARKQRKLHQNEVCCPLPPWATIAKNSYCRLNASKQFTSVFQKHISTLMLRNTSQHGAKAFFFMILIRNAGVTHKWLQYFRLRYHPFLIPSVRLNGRPRQHQACELLRVRNGELQEGSIWKIRRHTRIMLHNRGVKRNFLRLRSLISFWAFHDCVNGNASLSNGNNPAYWHVMPARIYFCSNTSKLGWSTCSWHLLTQFLYRGVRSTSRTWVTYFIITASV